MSAITSATKSTTAPIWTPFIEAQTQAMAEFLEEHLKLEVTDEMRHEIQSALNCQTDDFGSIFKSKRGRKAGDKNSVADEECRCCAFSIKDGAPVRCSRKRKEDEGDYCLTHSKQCAKFGGKPKFGRYDEEVPLTFTQMEGTVIVKENVPIAWTSEAEVARMKEAGITTKSKRVSRAKKEKKASGSKRAPSAYNLFMKDPEVRAKADGESAKEKMASIAAMWKEADDETKRPYEEKSAELKQEFAEAKEIGLDQDQTDEMEPKETKAKAKRAPKKSSKRAPSAYNLFMKDPAMRAKAEGESAKEKMVSLGAMWKSADEETKKPFVEEAARLKAEFASTSDAESVASGEERTASAPSTPTPKAATKKSAPGAPVKEAPKEFDLTEMQLDAAVEAFVDGDDEDDDMSQFPVWTHNGLGKKFLVDMSEMFLYEEETKKAVCSVAAMGGEGAFTK